MTARRLLVRMLPLVVVASSLVTSAPAGTVTGPAFGPVNPVRVDLGGHPANSGFLVFVAGNIALNADESEGSMAAGGDLSFNSTYNVAAHTPADATFTAPGDTGPTFLYVGGGMAWTGSQVLRVLNNGFTKIAHGATYTARNTDQNGAHVNYQILPPGAAYSSNPRIEGTTNQQAPASVSTPVPATLIDVGGAFTAYRQLTTQMDACPGNSVLTDPNGGPAPIPQPYPPGSSARLTLTPGETNVLQMSTADLANLSQITFTNQPSASTPLVVNVTGTTYAGTTPNLAGISGSQAPYILWNFPQALSIVVTGGASIEGTIYAPNVAPNWRPLQNIEGNVIAAAFTHGPSPTGLSGVRELHDFPFATTISCTGSANPTGTLTLVKNVDNAGGGTAGPGDWTLTADGPDTVSGPGNSGAVTRVTVKAGDYALSESASQPNYRPGTWHCAGGTLTNATVSVTAGADVTCSITNTYEPPLAPTGTLTLVKNVVNVGGGAARPSDWTLSGVGPETVTGPGNSPPVTGVTVNAGDYLLGEAGGPPNYRPGSWQCTGGALTNATVSVTAGADVTCSITNTYQPPPEPTGTLTLVKEVDNTGGGTATADAWTLTAAGPQTVTGPGNSGEVTAVSVGAGDYALTESGGPAGYAPGSWSCTGGTITGATVAVTAGADVVCSITNAFHPPPAPVGTLTLEKEVDNTFGGLATPAAWTLTAVGPETVAGPGGSGQVTNVIVSSGDYDLSESGGPTGYVPGPWSCTGGTLTGATVAVTAGADVVCSITNTFTPPSPPVGTLSLVKVVENTGGGLATPDAWTLTATGPHTADGPDTVSGPGNSGQVTNVLVTAGTYALSESGGPGEYSAGAWSCTGGQLAGSAVIVDQGAVVRCQITNTYAPDPSPPAGTLTLVKDVSGGSATPDAFTLTASGPATVSGPGNSEAVSGIVVPIGTYSLAESGAPSGYTAGTWMCSGGSSSGASVTVAQNSLVTCSITNTFVPESLPPPSPPPTVSPPPASTASASASASGSTLASTGADVFELVLLGLGSLILGSVLTLSRRRRGRERRGATPGNFHRFRPRQP